MKKTLVFILLISFMGQTFGQGWCYLGYLIQKKEYMKRCVNKDRPELKCNGKCLLMQKIREQEERERGPAPMLKMTEKLEVISSRSFFATLAPGYFVFIPSKFFSYSIGSPIDQPSFFFHPPNMAS